MRNIDPNTIYVALDATNQEVTVLVPRGITVVELRVDDPDPESTDRAEFALLRDANTLEEYHFDL